MGDRKKFPVLEKEKRQKCEPGQSQEVLGSAPSQIPGSQGENAQVDLKEYFQEYNEKKKKDNPEDK